MKFGNGCWLQKEGIECFAPQEAYFVNRNDHEVVICAPTHHIAHRGDTLGGINLTIRITAPAEDVIRVQTSHYLGVEDHSPKFDLNLDENRAMDVEETEDEILVRAGNLSLRINKKNWSMSYERDDKILTASSGRDLAYMRTQWTGFAYDMDPEGKAYMRQQLGIDVNEHVYGLGERFGALVRNGQSVDIWNEDGGTSTDQSYKNIPFYLTDKGYGVFVNSSDKVSFEVGTEQVTKVEFSVKGESLDYFVINGPTMKDVLKRYTDLTGKPSLPAPWTYGLWLSTSFTTNYDEETVMSFVDGMLDRGIGLRVFHFDCFWMKDFHWSDFLWDTRVFPDPEGMLSRIKAKGLNICVWINPYIAQESVLFAEGKEHGYFIKRPNGDVWQWDMWQPGMALVDFTNPEACKWFQDKLEVLLDMGVDCFKTDFGERIPVNCVYADGSAPEKMHNYYTYLYNKTVFELLERKRGKGEAVLFARSATVGGQKFPVHWGGDCWSDYVSMEESLRGGLSLTMSGFGYWSHDIGGFESTSTPDVYKRWAAFGLMSSHSRLHGSTSYRVPWAYDEEAVDVVRYFTEVKAQLMPYLYRNSIETAATGVPMMRSMVMEFTQDRNCSYLDKQYMLGDSLLVAPIFNDESKAIYYLPEGTWTHYLTGEVKEGGKWYEEHCGYLSIPVFARENSLIAVGQEKMKPDYDYAENVEIRAYSLTDGGKASTFVCGMDRQVEATVFAERNGGKVEIQVQAKKPCSIVLVNEIAKDVQGAEYQIKDNDTVIKCAGNAQITVTL
ncbi:alpha-xylosidase [Blautia sp. MSJ-19]|uniref:alpha-xylosidase n=1 Tax=Blautia sp. MSJ-19 TaxID=2841517 RepID=UPI001C0E9DE8|nr:alpha-xylosidase [Blautia sp. MSJ-19]MBU5482600.1 alpha-xylosidase [Blautia sp. MSJ-19]